MLAVKRRDAFDTMAELQLSRHGAIHVLGLISGPDRFQIAF